jgi:cytochrome P450
MDSAPTQALISDDELYDTLYDVRNEAKEVGNFIDDIDPYPAINALRDSAPVHKGFLRQLLKLPDYHRHTKSLDRAAYTCFTFATCDQGFRDNVNLSSKVYHYDQSEEKTMGILEMDNPEHHAFRKGVQSLFIQPRVQKWWRQHFIDTIVDSLVDNFEGKDRAELNLQYCARVPVHTVTRAVGLRGEDALIFRQALVSSQGSRKGPKAQMEAFQTVQRMLMEQITKRRSEPGEDVLSWLIAAEIHPPGEERRPLTDFEIVIFARLILVAGGGTTWRQLGITILDLLTHRDQFDAVQANPKLIDAAISESLRLNPTNPMFSRIAVNDVMIGDTLIPEGAMLDMCLGAANRDPSRWDNPDVFDLHRPFQQHLGTGIGAHMCLGRYVAQAEMAVAIEQLFARFPAIRLDPDAERPIITGGLEQRGVSELHVLLK